MEVWHFSFSVNKNGNGCWFRPAIAGYRHCGHSYLLFRKLHNYSSNIIVFTWFTAKRLTTFGWWIVIGIKTDISFSLALGNLRKLFPAKLYFTKKNHMSWLYWNMQFKPCRIEQILFSQKWTDVPSYLRRTAVARCSFELSVGSRIGFADKSSSTSWEALH